MARLCVSVRPDTIRFVLPSRLGRLTACLLLLFLGLGVIPAAATWLVGWAWAVPWSGLALLVAQPLVGTLRALFRPRIEVDVGLRRLRVRRSWFGVRADGWTAPWDQLVAVHLCGRRRDPRATLELVVVDHRGEWQATGIHGSMPELGPVVQSIRSQIRDQAPASASIDRRDRENHADLRRLASILGRARTAR